ncbi:MAG: hypothetical protein CVU87_06560 [Firmicutes bacterium HGW-Firmicutes-12]|jgi:hypothetical protein|nr:MAG: hypothetical protein CVU87_06560 [Firmicutes bacterium HGW-Firmicutes-12]
MRIRANVLGILVVIVIFGGIAMTSVIGLWNTTNTKVPAQISSGKYAGVSDPADIRGSYSFTDINRNFDVSIEDLAAAFGVEESIAPGFKCKDLEALYAGMVEEEGIEIGTDAVRFFVALYIEIPYTPAESTFIPTSAVEILKEKGVLDDEQLTYLESHSLDLSK